MPSTRSGASYNPSSSSQKGYKRDYGRSQSVTEGQGSSLKHHKKPKWKFPKPARRHKKCIAAQRVPDPGRFVEKLHEFLPNCEKIPGPSQHFKVTQWMESIDGKEKHDAFNSRMEERQPSTTQASAKNSLRSQCSNSNEKKQPQAQNKGKGTAPATYLTARATESQIFSRIPWKIYCRCPEQ
ncbi:hypothetical protein O181_019208 [Austropuccinia psidii MF-1]|uniref:Uncharacterized protein n=1 Tax=Austropuccinia psidii MF-1 TaxID=1389203 RepID=A0A9Q3C996_9BASI|nr:hypothetical protein [Austropuccinia psidii MF-1]